MVLKLYFDALSQPSRALYIFLKLTKVPFEACPVALKNGQHLTEEFKQDYSKFQKVPFIHDGNFRLAESIGIYRYVNREYGSTIEDHWYPKDSKQQAKVDEYLEWQHVNIRYFCATYFLVKRLTPLLTGESPSPEKVQRCENDMVNCLNKFEDLFLSDGPFINGFSQITIADIVAACEIEQPRMAGFDPTEGRPKLTTWLQSVRNRCNPYYEEIHGVIDKFNKKAKNRPLAKL